ncbi:MAG TPA: c-type cytochrome [Candidatus Sulfotelmatobacter sp.]|nr:c-type cytochrome [Candidatus Sulfotelmatobacter sp.]
MTKRNRFLAILAVVAMTACLAVAQEEPQEPAPASDQSPGQTQGRGANGRGAGRAGRGGGGGAARGGGRSPDGFPQFIRPLASQDVLLRGKSLYDGNCASCHAADLRGVLGHGPNLLRSAVAMDDEHGELIGATVSKHNPPLNLVGDDMVAVSEYIHSILATMGSQGSPPGRIPVGLHLDVLVGDPQAGKAYFDAHCASCHSASGDLKGIGSRYEDPRSLQNAWVSGASSSNPFAGRGGDAGRPVTVTMPNGEKIAGKLVRQDDFDVVMTLADGTRRTIPIENGVNVDVPDPQAAHKKMALELDDPENKNMHDVTAYLATLK